MGWPSEQGYSTTSCGRPDWLMGGFSEARRARRLQRGPRNGSTETHASPKPGLGDTRRGSVPVQRAVKSRAIMGATIRDPRATGVRKSPESRRHSRPRGRESGSIGVGERAVCGSGVRTRWWRTYAGTNAASNQSTQSGRRPLARPAILLTRPCSYRSRGGGGEGSGKSGIMNRRSRRAGGVRNLPRRVNTPKLRDGKYSVSGITDS